MRKISTINDGWTLELEGKTSAVTLPHTWNARSGQGDEPVFLRTRGVYTRPLPASDEITFVECLGVNSKAEVRCDGELVGTHEGGYSAFRFDITKYIKHGCMLSITADNTPDETVYPTFADFSFYGGIYRDVRLLKVPRCRFSTEDYGSCGVYVTPRITSDGGELHIKALIDNPDSRATARFELKDRDGRTAAAAEARVGKMLVLKMQLKNVHPWQGVKDPYLYSLSCVIASPDGETDGLNIPIGFRNIEIDSEKGLFLNGEHLKLRGVSRHQDREGMGNALTIKERAEDVELIRELGANSVRLAHYQHSPDFYDLCDEKGLLVWAEVPVISRFSPIRSGNAERQLVELIKQNYNRPSVFCWSIENEITMGGTSKKLLPFLKRLDAVAKKLDGTRFTACAQLSMCPNSSPYNRVTDILGYNHYFGWYMDTFHGIEKSLDAFHAENPDIPLCLSEYGAEGLTRYHSENPVQGDYSEEYQAIFHGHYIEQINNRDWLWGSYVWNMFDFGSVARNEGGVKGRNNKGLVTLDRKVKKDSFYLYKAYWSDEKFVHIAGENRKKRLIGKTDVRVYGNCGEVELICNGQSRTLSGGHVLVFENVEVVPGENKITAVSGGKTHSITFEGTAELPPEYSLSAGEETFVRNWFVSEDGKNNPSRLSLDDTVGTVLKNSEIQLLAERFLGKSAAEIVKSPLLYPLYPIKAKHFTAAAALLGIDKSTLTLANGFLQTIEK